MVDRTNSPRAHRDWKWPSMGRNIQWLCAKTIVRSHGLKGKSTEGPLIFSLSPSILLPSNSCVRNDGSTRHLCWNYSEFFNFNSNGIIECRGEKPDVRSGHWINLLLCQWTILTRRDSRFDGPTVEVGQVKGDYRRGKQSNTLSCGPVFCRQQLRFFPDG